MHWLLHFQVKQKLPFLFETPLLKLVKPRFTAIGLKFQSERAGERSAVSSLCHLFLIKYGNPQNAEILHTPIQFQTFIPSFLSSISASLIWLPSTCFSFHILEWKWLKSVRSFPHFLPGQPHVSACVSVTSSVFAFRSVESEDLFQTSTLRNMSPHSAVRVCACLHLGVCPEAVFS